MTLLQHKVILRNAIRKIHVSRDTRINEKKDNYLSQRGEVLKRISEFETFSICWPNEQYAARGYVAEVKKIIQTKDAFTRMEIEREKELAKHRKLQHDITQAINERNLEVEQLKKQLYGLFAISNPQQRGKSLEGMIHKYRLKDIP